MNVIIKFLTHSLILTDVIEYIKKKTSMSTRKIISSFLRVDAHVKGFIIYILQCLLRHIRRILLSGFMITFYL